MWDNLTSLAKKGIDIASDVSNTIAPLLADENPWNEDEIDSGASLRNEEENGGKSAEQEEEDPEIPPCGITDNNHVPVGPSSRIEGRNIMLKEELDEMETMFHISTRELQRLLSERDKEVTKLRSELELLESKAPNIQVDDVANEKVIPAAACRRDDTPDMADTEETAAVKMLKGEIASQQAANMCQAEDFCAQLESMQRVIVTHEQNRANLMDELTSVKNKLQVHAKSLLEAQERAEISESKVSSLNLALDDARDGLRTQENIALSRESELVEARAAFAERELLWKEEIERYSMSAELQQQLLASAQDEVQRKLTSPSMEHSELLPVRPVIEVDSADEVSHFETTTAADAELSQSSAAEIETKLEEMRLKFESQSFEMDHLKVQIQQYEYEISEGKQARSVLTNDVERLQACSDEYDKELRSKSLKLDVLTKDMERMGEAALQTQIVLEGKTAAVEDQSAELLRMEHSMMQLRDELGEKSSTILALSKELEQLRQKAKEGLDDGHHESALSDEDLKGGTESISMDNKKDDNIMVQRHEEDRERIRELEAELKEALEKLELNEGLLAKQIHDSEELTFQMSEALSEAQTKLDITERELELLTREHLEAKSSAKQLLESVERPIPSAASGDDGAQLSIPVVHKLSLEALQKSWEVSELVARRLAGVLSSVGIKCKLSEPLDVISALENAVAAGAFSMSREAEDNNSKLRGQISNLEKEVVALGKEVSAKDKTSGQLKVIIDQLRSAHRSGTEASSVLSAERDQLAATVRQTREELENRKGIIKDLESRLTKATSKAESARELQNKVTMLQESETEARAALEAGEVAIVEDLEKEKAARQEALHEAQVSGQSATEALADLALARADAERAQEAVVNMQRAFALFHEERSAEVSTLNDRYNSQKKESELALSVCEKALNEARESEKAAMDALNVVTERERVMAIELMSVQEEAEAKATALSNAAYSSSHTDDLVDKQLAANLVVRYISSHHDKQVLELMARLLNFTHDDLEAVGLERSGPGLMSEIMSTLIGRGENEAQKVAPLTDLVEKGGTLGDAWVSFLLEGGPNVGEQQNDETEEASAAPARRPKESQQPAEEK